MRITRATVATLAVTPILAWAAESGDSIEARLRALEQRQSQLEQQLLERDARIRELEAQVKPAAAAATAVAPVAAPATAPASLPGSATAPTAVAATPEEDRFREPEETESSWGRYEGGKGIVLARSDEAEVAFSAFTYVRYLNQLALDDTYTDAFGRTRDLDLRNDAQLQKVTLNFKGWLFDPDFRYLFYTWTSNTSQGQDAQVVVAGNLSYRFSDAFSLAGGIGALPSTRSTNYTFPNWLRVDNRTIADEFFRGSYTSGFWAWGKVSDEDRLPGHAGQQFEPAGRGRGRAGQQLQHDFRRPVVDADDRRVRRRQRVRRLRAARRTRDPVRHAFHPQPRGCAEPAGSQRFREQPDPALGRHADLPGRPVRHRHAGPEGHLPDGSRQRRCQVPRLVPRWRVLLALGGRLHCHRVDAVR